MRDRLIYWSCSVFKNNLHETATTFWMSETTVPGLNSHPLDSKRPTASAYSAFRLTRELVALKSANRLYEVFLPKWYPNHCQELTYNLLAGCHTWNIGLCLLTQMVSDTI